MATPAAAAHLGFPGTLALDATGHAARSNASDLGQSSTRSRPARRTPRAQPRGKGPPTGPGARADGPAPHARTPAPLWGPFPGQRAMRVFGQPPRAQSRQIRQRRRPAPGAGAIDAKKSALQAAASTASARAPAAPHGPGERAGQSFARERARTRYQRAAPRNRLAHRRAAGHTCRGRWMPRRQRPARAGRRSPAPAGRRPRRHALPSALDFSLQNLFYFRGHSGAFDPTPGCSMVVLAWMSTSEKSLMSLISFVFVGGLPRCCSSRGGWHLNERCLSRALRSAAES